MAEAPGCLAESFTHGIYSLNVLSGPWIMHTHWLPLAFFLSKKGLIYQNSLQYHSSVIVCCLSIYSNHESHLDYFIFSPDSHSLLQCPPSDQWFPEQVCKRQVCIDGLQKGVSQVKGEEFLHACDSLHVISCGCSIPYLYWCVFGWMWIYVNTVDEWNTIKHNKIVYMERHF